MADYVDGFCFPIARDHLEVYQALSGRVAAIWREHGAIDYREFIGDDLHLEGTRSFTDALGVADDEVVVFGWVTFVSREARDAAGARVAADTRVAELMANTDTGFDARRMVYGGFSAFVS